MAVCMQDYENLIKWGSCSWNYPVGWRNVVYRQPCSLPQMSLFSSNRSTDDFPVAETQVEKSTATNSSAELLREYCAFPAFSTLCFDMTHYRPYSCEELHELATFMTPDFPAVIKVWDQVTKIGRWRRVINSNHGDSGYRREKNEHFLNPRVFVDQFLPPFELAFKNHVGIFLFEFMRLGYFDHQRQVWVHYNSHKFNQALDRFLGVLPKEYHYAIELRDRNLINRDYARILQRHGVAHCFNQWETMASIREQYEALGFTANRSLVRVLTPPQVKYAYVQKAYAPYDRIHQRLPEVRQDILHIVEEAMAREVELFVVVNNRAEGHAPGTITELDSQMRNAFLPAELAA